MRTCICLLSSLLVLSGCGAGGGDGGDAPASTPTLTDQTVIVTTWYDTPTNTQVASTGPVLVDSAGNATDLKQGAWTFHFPPDQGGGRSLIRTFHQGVWDQGRPWTEFNADGSVRVDATDR